MSVIASAAKQSLYLQNFIIYVYNIIIGFPQTVLINSNFNLTSTPETLKHQPATNKRGNHAYKTTDQEIRNTRSS
jgi:hypothetical protein